MKKTTKGLNNFIKNNTSKPKKIKGGLTQQKLINFIEETLLIKKKQLPTQKQIYTNFIKEIQILFSQYHNLECLKNNKIIYTDFQQLYYDVESQLIISLQRKI